MIQIDINYLHRVALDEAESRLLWQPGELDRPRVAVVSGSELLAGKILALLDRGSPRDAWDVANLPESLAETISAPRFRRLFIALAATLDRPLTTYARPRLDAQLAARRVAAQLAPMLAVEGSPDARALVDRAWETIAGLLALSQNELEYFAAIDRGELRLDLLFPDQPSEVTRLAAHPALQWKLANVRGEAQR